VNLIPHNITTFYLIQYNPKNNVEDSVNLISHNITTLYFIQYNPQYSAVLYL